MRHEYRGESDREKRADLLQAHSWEGKRSFRPECDERHGKSSGRRYASSEDYPLQTLHWKSSTCACAPVGTLQIHRLFFFVLLSGILYSFETRARLQTQKETMSARTSENLIVNKAISSFGNYRLSSR